MESAGGPYVGGPGVQGQTGGAKRTGPVRLQPEGTSNKNPLTKTEGGTQEAPEGTWL